MKFNWVTFRVSDLEKSLFFYNNLLNLEISERFGNEDLQIVMLGKADEPKIELIYESGAEKSDPGNGVSIGLETDNIEPLINTLSDQGYKTAGPISPTPHMRFFFVQDPDGYTVQLIDQQ